MELAEGQQDDVLGMEREFTLAAQLQKDNALLPPDIPPRGEVRVVADT